MRCEIVEKHLKNIDSVYKNLICDRENDSVDWCDEAEDTCPCSDNETRCSKPSSDEPDVPGACIPPSWIYDDKGIWDCPDGK